MTTIRNDSLAQPYAAVDVSVYDSLATDTWTIESLARALALLTRGQLPPGVAEIGASAPKIPGDATSIREAAEMDAYAPSRVYRNALVQLNRLLFDETGVLSKGVARNPFVPRQRQGSIEKSMIEDALRALHWLSRDRLSKADDRVWDLAWEALIQAAILRFDEMRPAMPIRLAKAAPFGLLHRYRQHFFYSELRAGPLEQVKAIAPGELLEVVMTQTKSTTFEKEMETELEVTTNRAIEETDRLELSDRVAASISRSATVTASANGTYNAVLWSGGGSASTTFTESSMTTTERAVTRLQETTRKQSEQIRKRTTVSTRVVESRSESTTSRHVIDNKEGKSANYGLRRLGYDVDCKVQDLGPLLVWQNFISKPGEFLARSRLADREWDSLEPTYVEELQRLSLFGGSNRNGTAIVNIPVGREMLKVFENDKTADRRQIEHFYSDKVEFQWRSYALQEDFGSQDRPNLIYTTGHFKITPKYDPATRNLEVTITPAPSRWFNLYVDGTFKLEKRRDPTPPQGPDGKPIDERELRLEKIKSIFSGMDHIRERSALEYEERKALLAKVIGLVAPTIASGTLPDEQLEMLYIDMNDIFDLPRMFYDIDVGEWGAAKIGGANRVSMQPYDIHSEQKGTAPVGASLGWEHQIDADTHRDIFINAPFAWVGIPVKPGKEREATGFLRSYGLLLEVDRSLDKLVYDLRKIRLAERAVASMGYEEREVLVRKDSEVDKNPRPWLRIKPSSDGNKPEQEETDELPGDDKLEAWEKYWKGKLKWSQVYPVISAQHTVTTVDGFIFDQLIVGDGEWDDKGRPRGTP